MRSKRVDVQGAAGGVAEGIAAGTALRVISLPITAEKVLLGLKTEDTTHEPS
jgi:hypothetical protein